MKVSVIISTYSLDMYEEFSDAVESVISQTYDNIEILAVIDGSENSDIVHEQTLSDYGGKVRVHENEENVGVIEGRNRGAEIATGDVIAFMDDDAVADEDWVEELVDTYERRDAIAVGGRMEPIWVSNRPKFLPEEFYWLVGATYEGFPEEETEVRNTFASNISFRREVFLELGGFGLLSGGRKGDKNIQGGETELGLRMRREYGEGVVYNPDAVVGHKVYEHRTRARWLLDRAFWQGYSKRAMEVLSPSEDGAGIEEEEDYLSMILFEATPRRLVNLVKRPSVEMTVKLFMMYVFTFCVGMGYLYGIVRGGDFSS
jgi:GT2 family glycosyltransferase